RRSAERIRGACRLAPAHPELAGGLPRRAHLRTDRGRRPLSPGSVPGAGTWLTRRVPSAARLALRGDTFLLGGAVALHLPRAAPHVGGARALLLRGDARRRDALQPHARRGASAPR